MVKKVIFLFLILFMCCFSCKRSEVRTQKQIKKISQEEVKPLIALGQLWGFLKYHHPAVAEGKYDWDMELIKLIPSIQKSENETQWKKLLDNWIDNLPPVSENPNKELPDLEAKTKPDYGILFNPEYFYPETIDKIKYILDHGAVSSSHYINVNNGGRMSITNEPSYKEVLYPDLSYRLLSLFKYWNIVNYFFPYRELCDQKWSSVLEDMLPEFVGAADREQYVMACLRLVAKIDDSHGFFVLDDYTVKLRSGLLKVPFETRFVENKLVVTMCTGEDAYVKDNIKTGDIITAIEGESIDDIVTRMSPYISASNDAVKLREISSMILRGDLNTVSLTVQRGNKRFDLKVPRYDRRWLNIPNYSNPRPEEKGYQVLGNNIGYVLPSSCRAENRDEDIKMVLDGTKGLIIDMRCYPGDYISFAFLKHLEHVSKKFSLVSYANVSYPGYFFIINGQDYPNRETSQNYYKNKIVVIVNEYTQSQAEDNVLGFQLCPNVTVIGSTTAGANGAVTHMNLPGGIVTYMTGLGVYYPDGSDLQRVGVKIDKVIKPTISGIKNGKDELLERAIEIIENNVPI